LVRTCINPFGGLSIVPRPEMAGGLWAGLAGVGVWLCGVVA